MRDAVLHATYFLKIVFVIQSDVVLRV